MNKCKWCYDEVCVNSDCPMCTEYCPLDNFPGVCRFEERNESSDNNDKCKWISVENKELLDKVLEEHKKQYPDEDDVELIVCANTFPRSFMLFYDGKGFFAEDCNGKREYYFITHWMPLPRPYKESIKQ